MVKLFLSVLFLFIVFNILSPISVLAADSCTATVSPSSVQTQTGTNFSFSVTNTGSATITAVKITRPSDNFNLANLGVPGWSVNANNIFAELTGGTVAPGAVLNFSYYASSGSIEAPTANWTVETNTGSGYVACTGTLGTAISGIRDIEAPIMSDVAVTNIYSTQANIVWTTHETATALVEYSTTSGNLTSSKTGSSATSHSIALTGLTANTTYYAVAHSTDSSGNEASTDEFSFTTAAADAGVATTVTVSTTTTTSSSVSRAVVLKDTISPRASIDTDLEKPFEASPDISGKATDAGAVNAGINKVEYSVDGGENWISIDDVTGLGGKSVSFTFNPGITEDGNYIIVVRATDFTGNRGVSGEKTLIIDRLPPLVGGNLMSLGPLLLLPDKNGVIYTMAGVANKITMSAVGGPTSIDLMDGTNNYSLPKSAQSGLWSGIMNFAKPGFYKIRAKSIDGAGNETIRDLNSVLVIDSGKITQKGGGAVKGAEVSVFQQDEVSKIWNLWDAESFGQVSRQVTGEDGSYSYFLPQGTYYIVVKAKGYTKLTSKVFKIDKPTPLNSTFELRKGVAAGFFGLDFFAAPVSVSAPAIVNQTAVTDLIGKEAPAFSLLGTSAGVEASALKGRPSVLTFVSTWLPTTSEQISAIKNLDDVLEARVSVISLQENLSKAKLFVQKGGYNLNIAVDPDGETVESYFINSLPTHYFLNRQGTIKKKVVGVLSADEMKENLGEI